MFIAFHFGFDVGIKLLLLIITRLANIFYECCFVYAKL